MLAGAFMRWERRGSGEDVLGTECSMVRLSQDAFCRVRFLEAAARVDKAAWACGGAGRREPWPGGPGLGPPGCGGGGWHPARSARGAGCPGGRGPAFARSKRHSLLIQTEASSGLALVCHHFMAVELFHTGALSNHRQQGKGWHTLAHRRAVTC